MLESLSIRSFRLIPLLELQVAEGLTVLSGETGAGKSILLEALGLTLGERAEPGMVREGAIEASVVAVFAPPTDHPVWKILQEQGLEDAHGDVLVLKRILKKDGASRAFLQEQPTTLQRLRQIGELLVDIHGQFDRLLAPQDQTRLLDRYGACLELQTQTAQAYTAWREAEEALTHFQQQRAQAEHQRAFLAYCLEELQQATPFPPEEEAALLQKRQRMQQQEKLTETLQEASQFLHGQQGLLPAFSGFRRHADRLVSILGLEGEPLQAALVRLAAELEETEQILTALHRRLEADTSLSLDALDDRLHVLRALAKKHHIFPQDLGQFHADLQHQCSLLEEGDFQEGTLKAAFQETKIAYITKSKALHQQRFSAARKLEDQIRQQLPELKLAQASFFIQDTELPEDQYGSQGMHKFAFWIQTNQGAPAGLLHQTASGGELSRFLLLLKCALIEHQDKGTLIFDEIESGTGGAVAQAMGAKLKELSHRTQVLAITHAPQIAVYADQHWKIEKKLVGDAVETEVLQLSPEAHLEEVSRMLSGEAITAAARAAAVALKETALG